jgi:hypothetical protein
VSRIGLQKRLAGCIRAGAEDVEVLRGGDVLAVGAFEDGEDGVDEGVEEGDRFQGCVGVDVVEAGVFRVLVS